MMAGLRYQVILQISVCLAITLTSAIALPRVARAPLQDGTEDGGLWGLWGDWSACSRTCGGGVSFQERECLIDDVDGTECVGKSKRYESCNIQECPEGSLDFRSEQCAHFNSVPYEGKYYQWVPYLGAIDGQASNKCELNCMPKGQHFYYRLKESVVDGTMCNPDTLDVCVQGACQSVGCDFMLGSDAREDKCRECGGDGSTCKTIEGSFYTRRLPVGYNDILIIPAGATNIRVEERKPTNNYLALRNANGQYYINGNFSIDFPQPFSVAGTTVHYERFTAERKRNNAPEVFRALGPTSEPLFVVLVTQEKNKGILYEYSVQADSEAATKPDTYSWIFGSFDECSLSCGGGTQHRDVSCARNSDFKVVPDYLCIDQEKPTSNKTCNVDPCPPRWYMGDWSTCSKDCNGGDQVRLVYCEQVQDDSRSRMVSDDYCGRYIGAKPVYRQSCNEDPCPDWEASEWSKCSEPCGPGIQTRQVTCSSNNIILGITCDDSEKPEAEQECNLKPCQGVEWLVSDWGDCSEQCGHGMQTRQIYCGSFDGLLYRDDLCEGQPKPKMMKSCDSRATCNAQWHASKWSECSAKCGEGMRSRNVMCARMVANSWRRVPESECRNTEKFRDMEHCNNGPCEYSMWLTGPWTECSATCGGGQRERHVMCLGNGALLPDTGCDEDMQPESQEPCNNQQCEEGSGELTDCATSPYGCCPNGRTARTGPNNEGCTSNFRTTVAPVSPLATARSALTPSIQTVTSTFTTVTPPIPTTMIGCEISQFGCCPNRIDAATGPNGRGCDKERNEQHTCTLPRDSGRVCSDYLIKWYFDTDYSRCTQFWYGGCEGNTNRFDSEEECKAGCGDDMNELPQEDLCMQPKVIGPCKAAIPSYYYNIESGSCEHFLYGGCRGNNNRFRSPQECDIMCSTVNKDPCTLPRDPGRCNKTPTRMYYFDQSSGLCEQFYYSGCHGNPNRFRDIRSCQETCNVIGEESSVVEPQVPGSSCEEFRDQAQKQSRTHPGIYVPQCTLEGGYEIMQCHRNTGECWCVDENGIEINDSRKAPGPRVQRPDCEAFIERLTVCQIHERTALADAAAEPMVGRYIPQCTETGEYEDIQCYGSTGYCWCVNENGEEVEGTRIGPGAGPPDCISPEKTPCFKLRDSITSGEQTGVYIPECTPEGVFARLQCEGADECLCVNETNGDVLFPVGQAAAQGFSLQCDEAYEPDTTECQRHRNRLLVDTQTSTQPGQYVPQCNLDGEYEEMQCYTSTGFCWCVNKNGEEIDGTRTPPGFDQPNCLTARRRATPCHAELEDVSNSGLLGAHYPQCTDAGLYERIQCHASTGFCYCANETTGERFAGSYGESRGVRPDCSEYYSLITEILPEITYAPSPSVATNPTSPRINPISETFTTAPPIDFGVMTENLDNLGLVTMRHERCDFSLYGCCPDGKTPSATDDFLQCPGVSEPTIDVGSGRATALQDGTVTLQCLTTGIPEPNVAWARDGKRIDGSDDNRMYVGDDGSLTITFVQATDEGFYECSAYNGIGQAPKDTVELVVYTPADIPLRGQTSVTVQEGNQAVLECHAAGTPKPIVTWTNTEDVVLPNGNERMIQAENDSLIVNAAQLGDAGTYICTGKNLFGTIQRKEITLIVEADVTIVTPPRDTTASKGDNIVLTCGSTGSPKPTVRWSLNGIPIMQMSHHHDRFSINANGDLTISNLKRSDAGEYICTAANGQSSQSQSATVTVTKGEGGGDVDSSCTDNNELANCNLIVAAGYCQVVEYNEICCRSCRDSALR
ncbi:papilin-like isoform X2 [Amphiura filiformis]|uniref:papilin-like isoform X2 n=1 Tax=Amphiura filiformis TaxID=82378 RepID=UPI003B2258E8